ncbi:MULTISPECIES: amidohydrolase [unclassified Arthrobacter]|uniref:amidohydrolase n=1 Tax=unclassified Arthrobacter TaxID=235627 RepID=UPI002E08B56A|nr:MULTISPECIES: amidohydrolase [unclassified Arthrobacter]MEC5193084.1 putative amidohydrolase YtcJ [Arthrobacter sp. MP_M4]MEC5204703.1 putative amidohydrolase YtcJ [Arthrobacter sp. MP_M7]
MPVDLLIRNAHILTQDASRPTATSLLIHDGKILDVDPDSALAGSAARTIDAAGLTVVPGFNDVHAHSVWFGLGLMEANLGTVRSLADVYRIIADAADGLAPGDWVVASGFSPLLIGGQQPDRDRLDAAAGGRPVWIKHSSGHACTLNGAALDLVAAGADLSAPIDGGAVVVDDDGMPTGLLEENAMRLVQEILLPYPLETIERALDLATSHYLSEGITSVTDAGVAGGWIGYSPREFAAYQNARDRGLLSVRMQPMMVIDALHGVPGHDDDPAFTGLDGGIRTGLGDDWLRLGPVKIFSDGSLLGSTAYMTEDYVGCSHNHGYLQMDAEKLRESALGAYRAGWAVAMHAIGDHAIDHAIDIITEAQESYGPNSQPNRIEHGGVVRPDQLDRIAKAGIVLVPQPHFITEFGDGMARLLGPKRTVWSYPAKSLLSRGLVLPGSSDRPVSNGRPLDVMQSFVERLTPSGTVYGPAERITAAEALAAYTTGSAAATGTGDVKGRLAAGYLADLVFLDQDPTAIDPSRIGATRVLATMVGGQVRFGADNLPPRARGEDLEAALTGKETP